MRGGGHVEQGRVFLMGEASLYLIYRGTSLIRNINPTGDQLRGGGHVEHGVLVEAVARLHVRHPHLRPGPEGRPARPTGHCLVNSLPTLA